MVNEAKGEAAYVASLLFGILGELRTMQGRLEGITHGLHRVQESGRSF
jgi:hypothetical protein